MNKNTDQPRNDDLYKAVMELRSLDECKRFFDDLCSISELRAMEQRFQVAELLHQGMIYNDILEKTGASSATISRVNRSLRYGNDGYTVLFRRMEEKENQGK